MKPGPITKTPRGLLLEAAEIIRSRGLHKGSFGTDLVGAIRIAAHGSTDMPLYDGLNGDPYATARHAIEVAIGGDPCQWNDRPETTAEDAIAMLLRAAEEEGTRPSRV